MMTLKNRNWLIIKDHRSRNTSAAMMIGVKSQKICVADVIIGTENNKELITVSTMIDSVTQMECARCVISTIIMLISERIRKKRTELI